MFFRTVLNRKVLLSFVELAFVFNLLLLDVVVLGKTPQPPLAATTHTDMQATVTSPLAVSPTPCALPCALVSPPAALITIPPRDEPSQPGVKDYYIPFGSGQSSAADWQDVTGLQVNIDSTSFPNRKRVVFEASVHIPTGNQWAAVRIFNETDQHPVWFSDVMLAGGEPKLLISSAISLDSGNKLYQVQMKTQLQFPAMLDQARVHITLN